uniref:Uncharacterized protein n=1 Tax=Candidatus Kentrum sp. FM TaxID=2126340 RepID=A0A450T1T1_9GAMM|nr:MAG: hypothetical protein BECKFM1743C_GA0114222_101597 [Candidatus Kentron sp. FM]VFJ60222.1 MAG: hypothetical protein BECKFM1743A_GA0114220_102585 [Candidatus Kentron sp. FM]VFK06874.1 MAG: hypothetical protein BECKFM1743B_GA0114221_100271 [Candidatus Kentron sp. FM]
MLEIVHYYCACAPCIRALIISINIEVKMERTTSRKRRIDNRRGAETQRKKKKSSILFVLLRALRGSFLLVAAWPRLYYSPAIFCFCARFPAYDGTTKTRRRYARILEIQCLSSCLCVFVSLWFTSSKFKHFGCGSPHYTTIRPFLVFLVRFSCSHPHNVLVRYRYRYRYSLSIFNPASAFFDSDSESRYR